MDANGTQASCAGCEQLMETLFALRAQLADLQQRLAEQEQRNKTREGETKRLRREIEQLRRENESLKKQLEETERNAKRQTTRFSQRQRTAHPKRPGRKPGSAASHRPAPEKVDREIDVPAPDCPECRCGVVDIEVHPQFQTDLPPVTPVTTQFNVEVGTCPQCGRRVQGRHPEQVSHALGAAAHVIGPNAHSMAAQLKHHAGLSYAKISNFLADFFGLNTTPSTFVRSGQRLARRAQPTFELLKSLLRVEHVVHADETGWRIGLNSEWLWVFSSPTITVYQVGGGRGHDVPCNLLGEDFAGILVSDGLASYDPLPYLKAQCVGHVLARIGKLQTALPEPDQWDLLSLKALLQEAIDLAGRRPQLTPDGYRRRVQELENRLDTWLLLNDEHHQLEIARLAGHLHKHRHQWFMFLYDPLVPPTNNHAERMIRPAVIVRKLGGCNKTDAGAAVHSVLASLMVSCQQQGKRFLDLARELYHLPAPCAIPLASLPGG